MNFGRGRVLLVAAAGAAGALLLPISASAAPAGGTGFVTGGGIYDRSECAINFAVNGHQSANGANGTQSMTMSNAPGAISGCPGQGKISATVTCIAINGNDAEIRGVITKQTGSLGPEFFPPGNTVLVTDVQDNGNPSTGVPDTIVQYVDQTGTENNCLAPAGDQLFTVDNGNVTVHN